MFQASNPDGAPIDVRFGFWQWVKAGIGFSIGAGLMTFVFGYLWAIFYTRVFLPAALFSLFR